jgi:hypothetical protein
MSLAACHAFVLDPRGELGLLVQRLEEAPPSASARTGQRLLNRLAAEQGLAEEAHPGAAGSGPVQR